MVGYRWFRAGDLNAFFALMFDNVANLVILASLLIGAFHFPREIVLYRMVPGTAVGVLVGDLIYSWMAARLARRTGRQDVTAMPLGLNAPSIFGMSFGVLGPAYLATGDAWLAWKIGMAVTVLVGLFKMGLALAGNAVRRAVPRAALLGSLSGASVALIALLPMIKVFADPIAGFIAFGVILVTLVSKLRLPRGLPGAFISALVGLAIHYALDAVGLASPLPAPVTHMAAELRLAIPWPTLGFIGGLRLAWGYLPIALPFALSTIVGGVDNTESAAAAGDEYSTRSILMAEGFCTLAAGLCGGVIESTPYIGHPAYKAMGARAGYTIATALFVGLGGVFGYLPLLVDWIPAAAVAPILVYIGIEIVSQAFSATPARHGLAVTLAFLPSIAFLMALEMNSLLAAAGASMAAVSGEMAETLRTLTLYGNGFIVSALLWGAATAELIDHRFGRSALGFLIAAACCLFGIIHSPTPQSSLFLPWHLSSPLPLFFAAAYAAMAMVVFAARWLVGVERAI